MRMTEFEVNRICNSYESKYPSVFKNGLIALSNDHFFVQTSSSSRFCIYGLDYENGGIDLEAIETFWSRDRRINQCLVHQIIQDLSKQVVSRFWAVNEKMVAYENLEYIDFCYYGRNNDRFVVTSDVLFSFRKTKNYNGFALERDRSHVK